jgi:hypothetical protein
MSKHSGKSSNGENGHSETLLDGLSIDELFVRGDGLAYK